MFRSSYDHHQVYRAIMYMFLLCNDAFIVERNGIPLSFYIMRIWLLYPVNC